MLPFSNSKADLGAPSDIGAAAPPPTADPDAPPASGHVTPEAVHYHDEEQRCDGCDHFGSGNQCSVLKMPVSPEGGCNAFRAGAGEAESDRDEPNFAMGDDDDDLDA
jgi:hypothetical protein